MEVVTGFSVVKLSGMSELPYTGFLTCSFVALSLPFPNFLRLQNTIITMMKTPKTAAPPTAAPITVPLSFPLVLPFLLPGPSITADLEDVSAAKDDFDGSIEFEMLIIVFGIPLLTK